MINIENFSYRYGNRGRRVFDGFSLRLECGRVYGLLGRNGVGKSTLLYSIMGLLRPEGGSVTVEGTEASLRRAEVLRECYMVPEEFDLPRCSLRQYVDINAPFYPRFSLDDLERNLSLFKIERNPELSQLSMGDRKKVLMCFALACNTRLLIMDEPTNGLDIPSKSQFRKLIATGMSEMRTTIISTHQVADVENLLDHIVIIEDNRVLLDASTDRICGRLAFGENAPDPIYAQPWMGGSYTVAPNVTGEESALRLELLFNATLAHPDEIARIVSQ